MEAQIIEKSLPESAYWIENTCALLEGLYREFNSPEKQYQAKLTF
jgi:hypothetical protein